MFFRLIACLLALALPLTAAFAFSPELGPGETEAGAATAPAIPSLAPPAPGAAPPPAGEPADPEAEPAPPAAAPAEQLPTETGSAESGLPRILRADADM